MNCATRRDLAETGLGYCQLVVTVTEMWYKYDVYIGSEKMDRCSTAVSNCHKCRRVIRYHAVCIHLKTGWANVLCGGPHDFECPLGAGHPICMIFKYNSIVLWNDTYLIIPMKVKNENADSVLSSNEWVSVYGLTSHSTHNRSFRGWFLQAIWPNQQCQSTEGNQLVVKDQAWTGIATLNWYAIKCHPICIFLNCSNGLVYQLKICNTSISRAAR